MSTTGVSRMTNPVVFGMAVALAQCQHCPEGLVMMHRCTAKGSARDEISTVPERSAGRRPAPRAA
jgi:hypothetical protein